MGVDTSTWNFLEWQQFILCRFIIVFYVFQMVGGVISVPLGCAPPSSPLGAPTLPTPTGRAQAVVGATDFGFSGTLNHLRIASIEHAQPLESEPGHACARAQVVVGATESFLFIAFSPCDLLPRRLS